MLFNSIEFPIFLVIVFALFWLIPNKFRWVLLLGASYYFYMYWNPKLVFLILFTTVVSYVCGILLEKHSSSLKLKRLILAISAVVCLGVLLFFKYFNFLYDVFFDISTAIGGPSPKGYLQILLPVGISFYTFQTLSYVIDIYKGTLKAERHIGYYALFVTFFPQLVAGPIERPADLLPQLHSKKKIKDVDFANAFRYTLIGFFKKVAVADTIGILVNATYENPTDANGLTALISTVLFAAQIYCDFSGYSDIAVGVAKLFGVNLTENFKTPYAATSIKEFWSRWHISLSQWLRDYIYFPLGGNRVSRIRWMFNITTVFFISGLWHGASYNFIIWGLLHAFFQIVGSLTLKQRNALWARLGKSPDSMLVHRLRQAGTATLVTFAWIFFRASTLSDAITVITKTFTDYSFSAEYLKESVNILSLTPMAAISAILFIISLPFVEKLKRVDSLPITQKHPKMASILRFSAYAVMAWCVICAWIFLQASDVGSSFIYFQF